MMLAMHILLVIALALVLYTFIDAGRALWRGYVSIRDQYEREEADHRESVDIFTNHK